MTDQTHRGKIARLPRWAQDHIRALEDTLAAANERLAAGPDDSDTFADPHADLVGRAVRPLGKGVDVRFQVPGQRYGFIVKVGADGGLEVRGEYGMQMDLHAANACTLRLRP